MNENRLFVGNLSFQTGENDLQDYFAQAGAVTSVNLMLDKVSGKSRGFAFVEFATAAEAQKAIEQCVTARNFKAASSPSTWRAPARNARRAGAGTAATAAIIAASGVRSRKFRPSIFHDRSGDFRQAGLFAKNKSLTDCNGDLS